MLLEHQLVALGVVQATRSFRSTSRVKGVEPRGLTKALKLPSLSTRTGILRRCLLAKPRTSEKVSGPSTEIASTSKPRFLSFLRSLPSCLSSCLQGTHHVAQKLTTRTSPLWLESFTRRPFRSSREKRATCGLADADFKPPPREDDGATRRRGSASRRALRAPYAVEGFIGGTPRSTPRGPGPTRS